MTRLTATGGRQRVAEQASEAELDLKHIALTAKCLAVTAHAFLYVPQPGSFARSFVYLMTSWHCYTVNDKANRVTVSHTVQAAAEEKAAASAKEGLGRRVKEAEASAQALAETVEELRLTLDRQRASAELRCIACHMPCWVSMATKETSCFLATPAAG